MDRENARRGGMRTVRLAWGSLLVSKIVTFATQILAIPTAYRALEADGFAAYAAVTASANLVWALNLGIGGALVTPIAEASAREDKVREAELVQAGLAPLVAVGLVGALLAIPVLCLAPLDTLFGQAGSVGLPGMRASAVIAMMATLLMIPLSGVDALRQAYQEIHVGILIGTVFNLVMCCGLLLASRFSHSLILFVSVFVLPPLAAKMVSCFALLSKRRYLLRGVAWQRIRGDMRPLLGDGVRFLASSFSNVLIYQWPVYWVTRHHATDVSSAFAICTQIALVPVSSVLGMVQPLWSPIADAKARGDLEWLRNQLRKVRTGVVGVGCLILITIATVGDDLIRLWIGKPIALGWQLRTLVGIYVLVALWEGLYLTMCFGLGHLRKASMAVFGRVICFAVAVPALSALGGSRAIWLGLSASVLVWTSWKLPKLAQVDGHWRDPDLRLKSVEI